MIIHTRTTFAVAAALLAYGGGLLGCSEPSAASAGSSPSSDDEETVVDDRDDESAVEATAEAGARDGGARTMRDAAREPASGSARDAAPPSATRDAALEVDAAHADAAATRPDAAAPGAVAAACPAMKLAPGEHQKSVAFGGHDRTYLLQVPKRYTGSEPIPLVFDFHGYGQSTTSQRGASGFSQLGEQHGFAVVYPAGVGGSWHVDGCCGQAAQEKLDEVGAVRAILAQIAAVLCVDPKRIYASGISQGGGMAHHVGCLAADVFAAVAPVSSDLRTDPCEPSRPISQLSFRGKADTLSAYEGGPVGPAGMQYQSIGAKATLERWKTIDGCQGAPTATHELCETYTQCEGGVEVTLCSIPRGGHSLYSNPERFNLAEVAWEMFARQRLP